MKYKAVRVVLPCDWNGCIYEGTHAVEHVNHGSFGSRFCQGHAELRAEHLNARDAQAQKELSSEVSANG